MNNWYARFPVIDKEFLYFVSGNNIYKVASIGGAPQLCFQGTSVIKNLIIYNNKIAFTSCENGDEDIYLLDLNNEQIKQITFFQKNIKTVYLDNEIILFLSNKDSVFKSNLFLYEYSFASQTYRSLNIGPINWLSKYGQDYYLQKYEYGYLNWKGYQGGTAGTLFKNDKRLINKKGNFVRPFFYKNKIYFIWDDEINGNIYSCDENGDNITQLTFHKDFQVQDIYLNDGKISYTKLGQIRIFDIASNEDKEVILNNKPFFPSLKRKCNEELEDFLTCINADNQNLILCIRGNIFSTKIHQDGVTKLNQDLRFRFAGFTKNKKIFAFQEPPSSHLFIFDEDGSFNKFKIENQKITDCKASPANSLIAYTNHKHEIKIINIESGEEKLIFKGENRLYSFDWSFDGNWLVYSASTENPSQSYIRLYSVEKNESYDLTSKQYHDTSPSFDPEGKYIVFLSNRETHAMHDPLKFDIGFKDTLKPYLISLDFGKDLLAPWNYKSEEDDAEDDEKKDTEKKLNINLNKIQERIIALPIASAEFDEVFAIHDAKIILTIAKENSKTLLVKIFSIKSLSFETLYKDITYIKLSNDKKFTIIDFEGIMVIPSGNKPEEIGYKKEKFDFDRIQYEFDISKEWQQIIDETCWLIQEFYWSNKLAGVQWDEVTKKYKNIAHKINNREELEDILNQLQGELGTSHAFILESNIETYSNNNGYLGIHYENNKITKILNSNLEENINHPFKQSNIEIQENDLITHIDNIEINTENPLEKTLFNKKDKWINIKIKQNDKNTNFRVKALPSQNALEYRTWVNENQKYVHDNTENQIGYIHVPDMQAKGFKEFYRHYLNEYNKNALILDLRYNRGGNVSTLLLDQIRRKRLGLDCTRHHGIHEIPHESSKGNFVLLINAYTASDGEIFSHQFKMLKLGEIIGERTWGGVVGIMPRYRLIDNTLMSYPEFSTWFEDVGYQIENQGVVPDYEVLNDHMISFDQTNDHQLKKAIEIALKKKKYNLKNKVLKTKHYPLRKQ